MRQILLTALLGLFSAQAFAGLTIQTKKYDAFSKEAYGQIEKNISVSALQFKIETGYRTTTTISVTGKSGDESIQRNFEIDDKTLNKFVLTNLELRDLLVRGLRNEMNVVLVWSEDVRDLEAIQMN